MTLLQTSGEGDIDRALTAMETAAQADVWEAAKHLEDRLATVTTRLLSLLASPELERACGAAYVLGFARLASSREALEARLADPAANPRTRGHAAEALAYLGDPRSRSVVRQVLTDAAASGEVAYWALFALGAIGVADDAALLEQWASRAGRAGDARDLPAEARHALARIALRQA